MNADGSTPAEAQLVELGALAGEILDGAAAAFTAGIGAQATEHKGTKDFATDLDTALERSLSAALRERTGIEVHGEEYGGPAPDQGLVWVLDPIDGTANYSRRIPLTGTNLALLAEGVPVLGLTWLPLLGERYVGTRGGPVVKNGVPLAPLGSAKLAEVAVSMGNVSADGVAPISPERRFPTAYRFALLAELAKRTLRVRMLGTAALEAAWVASGVLGGAVLFGNFPWDTHPGAALVRAAAGRVSDLDGSEHTLASRGMVVGAPGVHEELVALLAELGDPTDERYAG